MELGTSSIDPLPSGDALKGMRRRFGVTQGQIAGLMGVSVQRVSNIESMIHVPPPALKRFLEALSQLVGAG